MPNNRPLNNGELAIHMVNHAAQALELHAARWDFAVFERDADIPVSWNIKPGKRGEELFHLILSGIKEVYDVDAVIAGGAVRDTVAGVTDHKDVDVFIPLSWRDFALSLEELGWTGGIVSIGGGPYQENKDKGHTAFPTTDRAKTRVQGVPIDLVFMDTLLSPKEVETFPIHAQRAVYTLEGGIQSSPEATDDIVNKQFTIDPTITDKDMIKYLLDKIEEWQKRPHYKDWKIVSPDIKEWWEAKEAAKAKHQEDYNKYMNSTINTGDAMWLPR